MNQHLDEILQNPQLHLQFRQENLVLDVTERICELMAAQNLSRADLARKMNVSRAAITQALQGDTNMTLERVAEFFFVLGHEAGIKTCPLSLSGQRVVTDGAEPEPAVRPRIETRIVPRIRPQDIQDEDDLRIAARRSGPAARGELDLAA